MKRVFSVLFVIFLVLACSGGETSKQNRENTKKRPEQNRITKRGPPVPGECPCGYGEVLLVHKTEKGYKGICFAFGSDDYNIHMNHDDYPCCAYGDKFDLSCFATLSIKDMMEKEAEK